MNELIDKLAIASQNMPKSFKPVIDQIKSKARKLENELNNCKTFEEKYKFFREKNREALAQIKELKDTIKTKNKKIDDLEYDLANLNGDVKVVIQDKADSAMVDNLNKRIEELKVSVNSLTAENSKMKRKLKREENKR